jgi:hypothetical protein
MPITGGTVTIEIPLPVTWRTSHQQFKGVRHEEGTRRLTLVLGAEDYRKTEELTTTLGVDMTNLFRQIISSMHKELCGVPEPGPS